MPLAEIESDLLAVSLFEGEVPAPRRSAGRGGRQGRLPEDGAPVSRERRLGPGGWPRDRDEFEPERPVAAALAAKQGSSLRASIAGAGGASTGPGRGGAAALVEGAILASYRFDRFKTRTTRIEDGDGDGDGGPRVDLGGGRPALGESVEAARVIAEAANRARELQDLPVERRRPTYLADRAKEIAEEHDPSPTRSSAARRSRSSGMGGLVAVPQGTAQEPNLIVLRYRADADGETLGLVGKGVTFDTGGTSIKPAGCMQEMKMDMSGAAAVLEAVAAIAELELPVKLAGGDPGHREHAKRHRRSPGTSSPS